MKKALLFTTALAAALSFGVANAQTTPGGTTPNMPSGATGPNTGPAPTNGTTTTNGSSSNRTSTKAKTTNACTSSGKNGVAATSGSAGENEGGVAGNQSGNQTANQTGSSGHTSANCHSGKAQPASPPTSKP